MSIRIGYKLCCDCHIEIEKRASRKRCDKCQAAHSLMLQQKRNTGPRIAQCIHCHQEFQARSSSHKVCDAAPCKAKQYGIGKVKTTIPTRAKAEIVSAQHLLSYSGDKFARRVNEYLRQING